MLVEFVHRVFQAAVFARQKIRDRARELRVREPVRRIRRRRHETAREFVFTLGAGLEAFKAVGDAVLDGHVVAGLEMQAGYMLGTAPVASVKRVAPAKNNAPPIAVEPRRASASSVLCGMVSPIIRKNAGVR